MRCCNVLSDDCLMCFQSARASSDPLPESGLEGFGCGFDSAVVVFAVVIRGCADVVGALSFLLGNLAGVAERRDPRDRVDAGAVGAVSDVGEHGAVLNLPEGAGEVMLESASREVSEIKIEGLSAAISAELEARNWVSSAVHSCLTASSSEALGPRW